MDNLKTIMRLAGKQKLAEWWCELNRWRVPAELAQAKEVHSLLWKAVNEEVSFDDPVVSAEWKKQMYRETANG